MQEKHIILLLQERNEDAIPALADQYGRKLLRLASNILSSEADVQECINDTYLAVWNTIPPNHPASLSAYVLRVCKNIAVSRLRANTAQKRSSYEVALDELSEAVGTSALEDAVAARELGRAIDRFLDTLNRDNRAIFLRRYWHGDSIAHIAAQYRTRENGISTRLCRIRKKLKDYLTKEGLL